VPVSKLMFSVALKCCRSAVTYPRVLLPAREPERRWWKKTTCAVVPGGMRTVRLRLITGSSTEPTVFESGRPSIIDTGLRTSCPRPINRERSVSNCKSSTVSPSTTTTCAAQTAVSLLDCLRARRKQRADIGHKFGLHE